MRGLTFQQWICDDSIPKYYDIEMIVKIKAKNNNIDSNKELEDCIRKTLITDKLEYDKISFIEVDVKPNTIKAEFKLTIEDDYYAVESAFEMTREFSRSQERSLMNLLEIHLEDIRVEIKDIHIY